MTKPLYKISKFALGKHDFVEITEEQFEEIKRARDLISFGLAMEEKLDLLAENYADFERELLDMTVQYSIFYGSIFELLSDARHRVNRRLMNLFTSIRLYHDQIAHALSDVYGENSDSLKKFRTYSSIEYDSNLSYRAIEELRNHVQHASLPITAISFPLSIERNAEGAATKREFKVTPYISVDELGNDKKFKRTVLDELKSIANKKNHIEIIPLVRKHISCIGQIHKSLRELCKVDLESAESNLLKYREMAVEVSEGLAAIQYSEDGYSTDHIPLTDRQLKRWRYLQTKNSHLEKVDINFVSSEYD